MIRRLRRRHRWMIVVVALVTWVLFSSALRQRDPVPIDQPHPELAGEAR